MLHKQEEIKFLLHTYGIKMSWLADKLGFKLQTLTYLLNESPNLDEDIYLKIKDVIEEYQLELDLFDSNGSELITLFDEDKIQLGIGERIRIFAKRKFGTLKGLADAMEISPQQLQQYISAKREPGSKILIKLLRLGCDINWLLGGTEKAESYRLYKLETDFKKFQDSIKQIISIVHKLETNI
ncbi:MAG: helix-turn-helix domain-containing protein [Melioribacteraceae bacterium]|nr:helix-turn-helix domain-containing protein [Melioribacteraceae bacterium]MCF8264411.1 helix-turn-helix domain-containing protein [Melioribacteraceae bacterium]MCF8432095.1 helix-turn-helix domain-containing protein [Melioribacteraceae bacterium]